MDGIDPAVILAQSWAGSLDPEDDDPEQAEMVAPISFQFPGLAPRQDEASTRSELARAVGSLAAARIGLVPARRPTDVLAVVGYNGTVNRYGTPAILSAVLRSREEQRSRDRPG